MFQTMAKELLEQHTDKTLYGKENIFVDSKGKEQITTSYKGCGHCFEIGDDYIDGKFKRFIILCKKSAAKLKQRYTESLILIKYLLCL